MNSFSGIWIPLVTPFKDGEVDYLSAQKLALHMVEKGVHGLVVCGTTGEAASLNSIEKTLLLESVLDAVGGRIPVLMGLSGSSTREVACDALAFSQTGIDGYLMSAPCYVRPSQAGIIAHFRKVTRITDLPIVIYNIPSRTGVNIDVRTIKILCESDQFVAVKECSGMQQMATLINDEFCQVFCGDDTSLFNALVHGGHGAISASAHVYPELFVALYNLTRQGKFDAARELFGRLQPLIGTLFSEPNPAPVKAALAMQGLVRDELRLPMLPASESCKKQLRRVLDNLYEGQSNHHVNGAKAYVA